MHSKTNKNKKLANVNIVNSNKATPNTFKEKNSNVNQKNTKNQKFNQPKTNKFNTINNFNDAQDLAGQILNLGRYKKKTLNKTFKAIHVNTNGIFEKIEAVKVLIQKENVDVLSLNELKCLPATANYILRARGFLPFFKCRADGKGGGACLLVKSVHNPTPINIPFDIEAVGAELTVDNRKCAIFSYYNAPNLLLSREFFDYINKNFQNYLLLGDLNAKTLDLSRCTNRNGNALNDIMGSIRGEILNNKMDPTHYWDLNGKIICSVLDYAIGSELFSDKLTSYSTLKNSSLSIYDKKRYHVPIKVNFNIAQKPAANPTTNDEHTYSSFLYKKANWNKYESKIEDEIINLGDSSNFTASNSVEKFTKIILDAANASIPKNSNNRKHKLELPASITKKIKLKNKWQREFLKTKSRYARDNMYELKSIIADEINEHRAKEWKEFIDGLGPHILSTKPLWARINRFRCRKKKKGIGTLSNDGQEINDNTQKANLFADRLEKVFNNDENTNFDKEHKQKVENFFERDGLEKSYSKKEKHTRPFTNHDVKNAIK